MSCSMTPSVLDSTHPSVHVDASAGDIQQDQYGKIPRDVHELGIDPWNGLLRCGNVKPHRYILYAGSGHPLGDNPRYFSQADIRSDPIRTTPYARSHGIRSTTTREFSNARVHSVAVRLNPHYSVYV